MACDDRQLTEAQRQAAFQQQRTGVQQAVRPFTGKPTAENLADYINRELFPAVKQTRTAVNDVYLQVADNAPSANPLSYYFSTETAAADPTVGRIRLNASPQNTATTIRLSQSNGRLQDVGAWLDVMAGSSTAPLGVVTLFDAINPSRFLRFDLNTMVDQGTYWDLGVTVSEWSHTDPFVSDEAMVVAFIPGVASAGATVPPGSLSPIAANTVLANATAATAPPTAFPLNPLSVLGRSAGNITAVTAATGGGRALYLRTNDTTTAIAWATISEASLPLLLDGHIYANMTGATSAPIGKSLANMAGPGLKLNSATLGDYQFEVRFPGAPIYDVMDAPFNAVGNGSADDTAAINAAIAAANAVPGVIYFGPAHRVTAALSTVTNNNIWLVGRGRFNGGTHIILDSASSVVLFHLNAQYCGVFGMWISGAQVNLSTAVLLDACYGAEVGHVLFSQMGRAVEALCSTHTDVVYCNADDLYSPYAFYAHGSSGGGFNHAIRFDHVFCGTAFPAAVVGTGATWASGQSIATGNLRFSNGAIWQAASTGTTGGTAPTGFPSTSTSTVHTTTFNDGGVTWYFAMPLNAWFCQGSYSQTFEMQDCGALQGGYGLSVEDDAPGVGSAPIFTRVHNFQTDHPFARGVRLREGKAAEFTQLFVTSVQEGYGVEIASTYGGGWRIVGGEVFGAAKATVLISKGDGILSGVQIAGGSTGFSAIEVTNSATNWVVENCIAGATVDDTSPDTSYGINIGAGCDVYIVQGNIFRGHVIGAILNTPGVATTRIVRNNVPDTTTSVPDGDYGDITVSLGGTVWNIDANVVGDAELRQGIACSVIGRSANSTGNVADIQGGTNDRVLARASNALAFQQVSTAMIADAAVTLAKMANLAAGAVIGRQIDAGTGVPVALTGREIGELARFDFFESFSLGSGVQTLTLDARTCIAFITPSAAHDVIIDLIVHGSSNTGARVLIVKQGSVGRVILRDGNVGTNNVWTPGSADYVLNLFSDAVLVTHSGTRWYLDARKISINDQDYGDITVTASGATWTIDAGVVTLAKQADLAQSRIIGRAEGAGTGVPQALTPTQVVAIIDGESPTWTASHRFDSFIQFGTSTALPSTGDIRKAGALLIQTADDLNLTALDNCTVDISNTLTLDGGAGVHITTANLLDIDATGNLDIDASDITVDSVFTTVISAGTQLILTASTSVDINSPHQLNNATRLTASQNSATVALNDLSVSGNVLRLTASGWLLSGMVPVYDGRLMVIVNAHATDNGFILNQSVLSTTAANRFAGIGTSRVVRPGEMALAWYDTTDDRWRLLCRDDVDL